MARALVAIMVGCFFASVTLIVYGAWLKEASLIKSDKIGIVFMSVGGFAILCSCLGLYQQSEETHETVR